MTQIAWLSLGNMGRGMTLNLAQKGNLSKPLILWNRTQARTEEHVEKIGKDKARVAKTIEEAVEASDIIFTMTGTDSADKSMYETALKVDVKGKIFVDCATVEPSTTNALAKSVEAKGASFLASPGMLFDSVNFA